tara:strand:- start:390 stop:569 length:180 start_codon:yes stop_codon:yes gene_type:complete
MNYDHWKSTEPQWEDYDICCGEPIAVGDECPLCCEQQLDMQKELECEATKDTQTMLCSD